MSLGLWGKALYSSNILKEEVHSDSVLSEPNVNLTSIYRGQRDEYVCMAVNGNKSLAALVSQSGIDLLRPLSPEAELVTSTKSNKRLLPTVAAWQGKRSKSDFSDESLHKGPQKQSPKSNKNKSDDKLVVADRNGSFQVYALTSTDLTASSSSTSMGRLIRSISFSTEQPNYLLTAVSDGSVRLWDLRQRLHRAQLTFNRSGDVTRDVSFQPGSETKFAAIYDSGVVQRWDIRQRSSPDYRINAHQQGLSLDWHPRLNYLATGGRDHLVQIWNMNTEGATQADLVGGGSSPDLVIQIPNSVQQVKWIDQFSDSKRNYPDALNSKTDILSSGIVTTGRPIEMNNTKGCYSCWSLEQPFMPVYTIETHSDSVSDIFVANSSFIWSSGFDGKFAMTDLRFEQTVREGLPPAIVDFLPWDAAAVSFPLTHRASLPLHPPQQIPGFQRRPSQLGSISLSPDAGLTSRVPMVRNNSYSIQRGNTLPGTLSNVKTIASHGSPVAIPGLASMSALNINSSPISSSVSAPGSLPGSIPKAVAISYASGMASRDNSQPGSMPGSVSPSTPWAQMSSYFGEFPNYSGGYDESSMLVSPYVDPKFIVEVGLPIEDGDPFRKAAAMMIFIRRSGETFAQVCRHNSKVMSEGSRFRFAEMWTLLAVAIENLEENFLKTLSTEEEINLATSWFSGLIDDNYEGSTIDSAKISASKNEDDMSTDDAVFIEDDDSVDDSEWPASSHWSSHSFRANDASESRPKLSHNSRRSYGKSRKMSNNSGTMSSLASSEFSGVGNMGSANSRPKNLRSHSARSSSAIYSVEQKSGLLGPKRNDMVVSNLNLLRNRSSNITHPFEALKERFWSYAESCNQPWQFVPLTINFAHAFIESGYYTSAIALLLIFRSFRALITSVDIEGTLQGGLLALAQHRCFVPACVIRKSLKIGMNDHLDSAIDFDALVKDSPDIFDTVCHRCDRSLSDNAAFYARNDQMVGYFYCSRCRLLLDGCSLCDEPIRGLCKAIISCGHRLHIHCWNHWIMDEKMTECPSGCGQVIAES